MFYIYHKEFLIGDAQTHIDITYQAITDADTVG